MIGNSDGGAMAVQTAVNQAIPVSGHILFCPGIPLNLRAEKISGSLLGICMLKRETDHYLPRQKPPADRFTQAGVPPCPQYCARNGTRFPGRLSKSAEKE